jgi:hypothetical protein
MHPTAQNLDGKQRLALDSGLPLNGSVLDEA